MIISSDCLKVHYYQFTLLLDGRIGLIRECTGKPDNTWDHDFTVTLVAFDYQKQQFEKLTEQNLPDSGEFSWITTQKRGVFAPIGIYSTLYWLTPKAIEPIPITLQKGARSWYLPDSINELSKYQTSPQIVGRLPLNVGLARDPVWSPNGSHIAFWATLETIGQNSQFPSVQWDLYLLDPITLTTERVISQIHDPTHLLWSPDNHSLIYISGKDWWTTQGIWLYSLTHKRSILIQAGHFSDVALSPDGNTLAATKCYDDSCSRFEVWTYDLRELIK